MAKELYKNTGLLFRFILRQDRFQLLIWLISLTAFTCLIAVTFTDLYVNQQERQEIAQSMINPAVTAMVGPGYGLENYTYGAMMAHQMLGMTAIITGIVNILLVARHTRTNEENGSMEMIRSLPSGRLAPLHAAILAVLGLNIILAIFIGFGLYALQIESMNFEGSLLYGAVIGVIGLFFAAVTALFAQLSENSRSVIGLSMGVLVVSYLIRAVGDVSNETLSWFSPFGWVLGTEAYVNNYWWPLFLTAGVTVILVLLAYYLNMIRDLEAGFLPSKPGKKQASPFLMHPFGLALRLQRTGIIAWSIGLFIFGSTYGSVLGETETFFEEIEMMQEFIQPEAGFSITEKFLTMLMAVISMIATIPALMTILKLKMEEKKERTENILGLAVSRTKLMGSYFLLSMLSGFIMLSLAGLGMGIVGTSVMEGSLTIGDFYGAAMVYLPAMWIMIGIAMFLTGIAPNLAGLTWIYLIYSFIVVYLGGLFQFPDWVGQLSPFDYIPQLPVEEFDVTKVAVLTVVAVGVMIAGFLGYNKRDIEG